MKALVFKGPHQISIEERRDPVPGKGEVLLRVVATGICGSDLHGYTGENGRRQPGQVMGHETVGRIVAIGAPTEPHGLRGPSTPLVINELVTVNPVIGCGHCAACLTLSEQRCPERRVIGVDPTISAAFAEFMVAPARNVVPLSETFPAHLGALIEPLAVGYHATRRGQVDATSAVLVIGGGPIGQAAALATRRNGGDVVISELNESRCKLVRELGFRVINPDVVDPPVEAQRLLRRPPDVVIDAVGTTATIEQALRASAIGSSVVIVGMNSPQVSLDAFGVSTAERTIIGSFCYGSAEFADTAKWAIDHADELAILGEDLVALEEAPTAFAALANGTSAASKILVYTDHFGHQP